MGEDLIGTVARLTGDRFGWAEYHEPCSIKDITNKIIAKDIDEKDNLINYVAYGLTDVNFNPRFNFYATVKTDCCGEATNAIGKKEDNKMLPDIAYSPKKIYRRDRATIVEWMDGTKTIVVLEEDASSDSMYHAFCSALAKKMFGSTGKVISVIDKHDEKKINERKRKLAEKALKEKKKIEAEQFEKKVQKRAEEIAIERAAIRKLKRQHRYD